LLAIRLRSDNPAPADMNKSKLLLLVAVPLLPAAFAIACGGSNDNLPPPPPPPPPPPATASAAPAASSAASAEPTPPPPPPAPPVQLVQGVASPDPAAPTPTVKFVTPTKDLVIPTAKAADYEVKVDVKNWKTAKGDAHVHLILDGKPYKPLFDTKAPVKLSELTTDPIADGQHVLVAFPSRANHESVKTAGALSVLEFWVGKKGDKVQDVGKPLVIYSRPKGEYKGDMANHVLVDFQVANATLAPDKDHVHIAVSGPGIDGEKTADVTKFGAPYYLDNLQDGSYSVKLSLVGADGKDLPGPWNSSTHSFSIAR
jgi:hypothetical protein